MKVIITSGKRKRAIARAKLSEGTGKIRINSLSINEYEPKMLRLKIQEPLLLAGDVATKVDITVSVKGGGVVSQADAVRLAVGRALVKFSSKLEKVYLNLTLHKI